MSTDAESKFGTASGAEEAVFEALHALPDGYQVVRRPEGVTIKSKGLEYSYEPDFLISDPEGRTLMVEVKRPASMSWSNMARFVQIDRTAKDAGAGFLVLVPGEEVEHAAAPVPEFNSVNIAYANDEPGMAQAVIEALHATPATKQDELRRHEMSSPAAPA